jgi:hypothetical protein
MGQWEEEKAFVKNSRKRDAEAPLPLFSLLLGASKLSPLLMCLQMDLLYPSRMIDEIMEH